MKDRNSRIRTFEQLNQGQIVDSSMTARVKVELETDGRDSHAVIMSRLKRYRLANGGQSFFWVVVFERGLEDPDRFEDFYDAADAITDAEVDREINEVEQSEPGICQRIANFFS